MIKFKSYLLKEETEFNSQFNVLCESLVGINFTEFWQDVILPFLTEDKYGSDREIINNLSNFGHQYSRSLMDKANDTRPQDNRNDLITAKQMRVDQAVSDVKREFERNMFVFLQNTANTAVQNKDPIAYQAIKSFYAHVKKNVSPAISNWSPAVRVADKDEYNKKMSGFHNATATPSKADRISDLTHRSRDKLASQLGREYDIPGKRQGVRDIWKQYGHGADVRDYGNRSS